MRYWFASLVIAASCSIAAPMAIAAEVPEQDGGRGEAGHPAEVEALPHPTISTDGHWAGAMAMVVFFMFVAAAVVGPVVRANMPEEVPPAHSHDEPPGASHHHGPGGTAAEEPHH